MATLHVMDFAVENEVSEAAVNAALAIAKAGDTVALDGATVRITRTLHVPFGVVLDGGMGKIIATSTTRNPDVPLVHAHGPAEDAP